MSVCYDKLGTCSNLQPLAVLKRVSVACSNTHSRAGLGNSTMAKEWAKKKVSMSILYSNLTVNRFHWSCFLRKKFPKWHQIEALLWKVVSTTGTSMFTYSETFLSLTYKTRLICIVRLCKCPGQMKKKSYWNFASAYLYIQNSGRRWSDAGFVFSVISRI